MSASLVGSEMCIRDRWRPPPDAQAGLLPGPASASARAPSALRGPSLGTVSYTHLTLPTICSV
eukprot:7308182-Alexandrium_andersonii.AAC.1